ncbi:MAG: hypothetical protein ACREPR_11555 [Brasilonema sp.]
MFVWIGKIGDNPITGEFPGSTHGGLKMPSSPIEMRRFTLKSHFYQILPGKS